MDQITRKLNTAEQLVMAQGKIATDV